MVFDALGIKLGAMFRHADGDEKIDDEAVAGADAGGKIRTLRRQKDAAIKLGGREPLALEPCNALDRGRMRDAEPTGDVDRASLALRGQEIVDQLDIIL